jgi:hypothetical protein
MAGVKHHRRADSTESSGEALAGVIISHSSTSIFVATVEVSGVVRPFSDIESIVTISILIAAFAFEFFGEFAMEIKTRSVQDDMDIKPQAGTDFDFDTAIYGPSFKGFIRLSGPCEYSVSWGLGTRLALVLWLSGILVPFCIVAMNLDPSEISGAFVVFGVVVFSVFILHLCVLIFVAPFTVTRDLDGRFKVCVSPFRLPMYSFASSDILSIKRFSWKEIACSSFVGFPTDWTRSVEIRLQSGRRIVVSLKDPEQFITDCSPL